MRGGGTKEKGILALAWISQVLAVAGGSAIAATFIGGIIAGAIGLLPDWVAIVLLVAGVIAWGVDLIVDGVPNRLAIWMGIVLPSVARAVPGKLGANVIHLSGVVLGSINHSMGEWVGTSSTLGVAAAAVVASLLVARRVIAKGGR